MLLINAKRFGYEEFHNGEVIYKDVELDSKCNTLELKFESNKDIANLLIANKFIRDKYPKAKITLKMLYIPYSRMDREIVEGKQIFSLKYFAELINDCKFDKVEVLDPHSKVSTKLLNNLEAISLGKYVLKAIAIFKPDFIFYPDKGANTKYTELLKGITVPHFYGTKERDLANHGKIIEEKYELHEQPNLEGKSVLIVDDLVSMGGTAYLAAKQLKLQGAKRVALYVSHCENGIFVGKVLKKEEFKQDKRVIMHVSNCENGTFIGNISEEIDKEEYTIDTVYTVGTTPVSKTHKNLVILHT